MLIENIITIILMLFFSFVSIIKISGHPKKIFNFQKKTYFNNYGINRFGIFSIGILELFGVIGLFFIGHILSLFGALAIFCSSIGAIFFHLRFDKINDAIPAIVTLILSSILLFLKY